MFMFLKNFVANFSEKMFTKSVYLLWTIMRTLFVFKSAIWVFLKEYTLVLKLILKVAMYTIKTL